MEFKHAFNVKLCSYRTALPISTVVSRGEQPYPPSMLTLMPAESTAILKKQLLQTKRSLTNIPFETGATLGNTDAHRQPATSNTSSFDQDASNTDLQMLGTETVGNRCPPVLRKTAEDEDRGEVNSLAPGNLEEDYRRYWFAALLRGSLAARQRWHSVRCDPPSKECLWLPESVLKTHVSASWNG